MYSADCAWGHLKATDLVDPHEIISDAILDALVTDNSGECATISITALSGIVHPKTIQLRALVGNEVVLILIDSGSTHTFVDQALLNRITVKTEKLPMPLQVRVANGDLVSCTHMVPQLTWWIQGHNFNNAMQVLPLGWHDIILGMDWLEQWGIMKCHWAERWIQFQHEGQEIRLQGVMPVKQDQLKEISAEQPSNGKKAMRYGLQLS